MVAVYYFVLLNMKYLQVLGMRNTSTRTQLADTVMVVLVLGAVERL